MTDDVIRRDDIIDHAGPISPVDTCSRRPGPAAPHRRMVAGSRPGTRAATAYLRASSGDRVSSSRSRVQREGAGERDSTTLHELVERHS